MGTYDEEARWKIFRSNDGRCICCGARLKWENHEIKGLDGGWLVDEGEEEDPKPAAPCCFRCQDHPIAKKRRKFIIDEGA